MHECMYILVYSKTFSCISDIHHAYLIERLYTELYNSITNNRFVYKNIHIYIFVIPQRLLTSQTTRSLYFGDIIIDQLFDPLSSIHITQ